MSARALLTALALVLLAGTPANAREAPPPVGTPLPFALPAKTALHLDNGLGVTLVPFGAVPKVTLLLTLRTGNVADGAKTGLADLVAELLKEGAGDRDASGIARLTAEMGGALVIGAGADQFTLSIDVLAERAPDAVRLLADVLRRPRLPAAELARLKADMRRQTAVARSQAQGIAGEAFAHLMWGEQVYGRTLPSDATIDSMTIDDVRHFVATEFGAARAHLYVAGRFERGPLEAAVRAAFGDWAGGTAPRNDVAVGARQPVVQLIDRPGAAQSTILLGLPVPATSAPGFMRLSVANALLGGSLLSRLDQNLREDKGYTYGAGSHISPYLGTAAWVLSTDVNAPQTAAALAEVFHELARLRSEAPSAEELRLIQNYRAGAFVIGAASRAGLLSQLAFLDLQGLPEDWLTNYVQHVFAVTPDEVRAAAQEALDPAAMTLVVVGDLKLIKPSVAALDALHDAQFR